MSKSTLVIKTYARRDSATAILRKLGVPTQLYKNFVNQRDDQFELDLTAVEAYLANPTEAALARQVTILDTSIKAGRRATDPVIELPVPEQVVKPTNPKHRTIRKNNDPIKPKAGSFQPLHERTQDGYDFGSLSETTRNLILNGMSNKEVWAIIKPQFNLDDNKRHYPTWYRCEMRRKGLLPPKVGI